MIRFLCIFVLFQQFSDVHTIYRARKSLSPTPSLKRSAVDDALDMEAAELIFKEQGKFLRNEGNAAKGAEKLPFGTENVKNDGETSSSMRIEKVEKTNLESSMVSPSSDGRSTKDEIIYDNQSINLKNKPIWTRPLASHLRIVPYDFNIDADFPKKAPIARGLVGIPNGWNSNRQIDEDFRFGYRRIDFRRRFA